MRLMARTPKTRIWIVAPDAYLEDGRTTSEIRDVEIRHRSLQKIDSKRRLDVSHSPERAADSILPRNIRRLKKGSCPGPLTDDDGSGQPSLDHTASRAVERGKRVGRLRWSSLNRLGLYAGVYSLELLACERRILGEGLVEVYDDRGECAEQQAESDDDEVAHGFAKRRLASEIRPVRMWKGEKSKVAARYLADADLRFAEIIGVLRPRLGTDVDPLDGGAFNDARHGVDLHRRTKRRFDISMILSTIQKIVMGKGSRRSPRRRRRTPCRPRGQAGTNPGPGTPHHCNLGKRHTIIVRERVRHFPGGSVYNLHIT